MPMKCDDARSLLSPFLDGELDSSVQEVVRNHIEGCPDCSLHYEELKALRGELRSLDSAEIEVREEFTDELLRRGREEFETDGPDRETDAPASLRQRTLTRTLLVATLLIGLTAGTLLGLQLTSAVESSRSGSTVRQSAENVEPERPISANPSTFADAYFELATAEAPAGTP